MVKGVAWCCTLLPLSLGPLPYPRVVEAADKLKLDAALAELQQLAREGKDKEAVEVMDS